MSPSLLATLNGMLEGRSVNCVAESLGTSEQSALEGLRLAIAAVLGGVAAKAESPESLRTVLDLAPKTLGDNPLLQAARCAPDPNSSLIVTGRYLLARIFGNSTAAVSNAVGSASGLSGDNASTLLAMVAPLVMGFIGNHARMQGMNMTILGNILKQETPGIRKVLPAGLDSLLWPGDTSSSSSSAVRPAAAATSRHWVPLLVLPLLIFGLVLLYRNIQKPILTPAVTLPTQSLGSASRTANDPVETVRVALGRMELYFDAGSTKLRPESRDELDAIVSTLAAYPDVHLTLTGHTDNASRQERASGLSRRRAAAVMAELVHRGVPTDHLTAEGNSPETTAHDTSSEDERADRRKVTLEFSEH